MAYKRRDLIGHDMRDLGDYVCFPCEKGEHDRCADTHEIGSSWSFCSCKSREHQP